MDPRLRRSVEPLDVLYFWRQAGGIEEGTPWMAVFALDEVCVVNKDNQDYGCVVPFGCSILLGLIENCRLFILLQ